MTIPMLLGNYQKEQTIAQLKKAYSTMNQVVTRASRDQMTFNAFSASLENSDVTANFNKYWAPYLNIVKVCTSISDCGYKTASFKQMNNTYAMTSIVSPGARTTVMLADGMMLLVGGWTTNALGQKVPLKWIVVDLNGAKGPNKYGYDVFFFEYSDMEVRPMGAGSNDSNINANCSKSGDGMYCAAKIMKVDNYKITYW